MKNNNEIIKNNQILIVFQKELQNIAITGGPLKFSHILDSRVKFLIKIRRKQND